jgi:hypothetical protein
LAVFAVAAAVIGPARDYKVAARFPDWIAFSPGVAPILAVATIYALLVLVGHAVMRMVSGPPKVTHLHLLGGPRRAVPSDE